MRLEEALGTATQLLQKSGSPTPRLDAEILLAHVLRLGRENLLTRWDQALDKNQIKHFITLIKRRETREPVARITGVQEFWSLPFKIIPETLIPRPDSETLVSAVLGQLDKTEPCRILDLGTGTGCLLLALLSELPNASGVGVDISKEALACASENAKNLTLADRSHFAIFNWMGGDLLNEGRFDMVISNPPYIPTGDIAGLEPEVSEFAPEVALDGGKNGLDHYKKIIQLAPDLGGNIALEIGDGQAGDVSALLEKAGYQDIKTHNDLAGKARVITAVP